eukprot:TRINITY_DN45701_c0_g1_i1.p1 TRINITY_DN45701_c0_g1~~TRINITY_DN45701_c0_g1_i1.p1  ORF type:complete len:509 (+),score=87.72 TRINITY_DN45701_c0_g1_i1:20-1546(+)
MPLASVLPKLNDYTFASDGLSPTRSDVMSPIPLHQLRDDLDNLPTHFGVSDIPVFAGIGRVNKRKLQPTSWSLREWFSGENSRENGVDCDFDQLSLGNQMAHWRTDAPSIRRAYNEDLEGKEIQVFWPGQAEKGECNDVDAKDRSCWYRAKLLNDVSCSTGDHCLHFAAHDGMNRHTYTCPSWVRNSNGMQCKLPPDWQACPRKFDLKRVDSGVPQDFKSALRTPCPYSEEDEAKLAVMKFRKEASQAVEDEFDAELKELLAKVPEEAKKASGTAFVGTDAPLAEQGSNASPEELRTAVDAGKLAETIRVQKLTPEEKKLEEKVGMVFDEDNPSMALKQKQLEIKTEMFGEKALSVSEPQAGCSGSTLGVSGQDIAMLFDIRNNSWYRCTHKMRCEPWFIQSIREGEGQCGREVCGKDDQCFVHRVSSKRVTNECIPTEKVWLLSSSDDQAKVEASLVLAPPLAPLDFGSFWHRSVPVRPAIFNSCGRWRSSASSRQRNDRSCGSCFL